MTTTSTSSSSSATQTIQPTNGLLAYANGFSLCDVYSSVCRPQGHDWEASAYGGYAHANCKGPLIIPGSSQTLVVDRTQSRRHFSRVLEVAALAGLQGPTKRIVIPTAVRLPLKLVGRTMSNLRVGRCQTVSDVKPIVSHAHDHLLHLRLLHTTDATNTRFNAESVLNFIHESGDEPRRLFYSRDAQNALASIDVVKTTAHALTELFFYSLGVKGCGFDFDRERRVQLEPIAVLRGMDTDDPYFEVDMPTADGSVHFQVTLGDGEAHNITYRTT